MAATWGTTPESIVCARKMRRGRHVHHLRRALTLRIVKRAVEHEDAPAKNLADCTNYAEAIHKTITALDGNRYDFPFVLYYTAAPAGAVLTHSTELGDSAQHVPLIIGTNSADIG